MILEIFLTIVLIILFWGIPALLLSLLIKKIIKKKISKGWCVLVGSICFIFSSILALTIGLDWSELGTIWKCFSASVVFGLIRDVLYDSTIPSILDTEKQLKEKRAKIQDADV